MIKKTITYTDYNGVERNEAFYFNLTKTEVIEMDVEMTDGFIESLRKMVESQDAKELMKFFKGFIFKAYGEKSSDGKRFVKSDELSTAFLQTEAYSNLFVELCTDADKAAEFLKGVLPQVD